MSRDAFAGLARDEEERDEKIATERRERTEDREHAETVTARAAAERLGPELLDGFADAIGLLKGCADIMKKIGRPATAATLDTKAAELLALLLKATQP